MNQKILFNDGWEFAKTSLEVTDPVALKFEPVDLPNDWLIYNTLNLYENSIGWYRKRFTNTKEQDQILMCFDGVYMDSSLYVNQQVYAVHPGWIKTDMGGDRALGNPIDTANGILDIIEGKHNINSKYAFINHQGESMSI